MSGGGGRSDGVGNASGESGVEVGRVGSLGRRGIATIVVTLANGRWVALKTCASVAQLDRARLVIACSGEGVALHSVVKQSSRLRCEGAVLALVESDVLRTSLSQCLE